MTHGRVRCLLLIVGFLGLPARGQNAPGDDLDQIEQELDEIHLDLSDQTPALDLSLFETDDSQLCGIDGKDDQSIAGAAQTQRELECQIRALRDRASAMQRSARDAEGLLTRRAARIDSAIRVVDLLHRDVETLAPDQQTRDSYHAFLWVTSTGLESARSDAGGAQLLRRRLADELDDASGHLALADLALETPDLTQASNQIEAARAAIARAIVAARFTVESERQARETLSEASQNLDYVIEQLNRLRPRN